MNMKLIRRVTYLAASVMALSLSAEDTADCRIFSFEQGNKLHFAWQKNGQNWTDIQHDFLSSDYGTWGAEKKLHDPFIFQDAKKTWYCIFTPNHNDPVFAIAASPDLVNWHVQDYHTVATPQCLLPFAVADKNAGGVIYWQTKDGKRYCSKTADFKKFTDATAVPDTAPVNPGMTMNRRRGYSVQVDASVIDTLIDAKKAADEQNVLNGETISQDAERFAGLKDLTATVTANFSKTKDISPLLMGIFFEDISYAADGGLYAELIRNRDFEFNSLDRNEWNAKTAWTANDLTFDIAEDNPIHKNNPHHAVLTTADKAGSLVNEGFDGIVYQENDAYLFSAFLRSLTNKSCVVTVELLSNDGIPCGSAKVTAKPGTWQKVEVEIKSSASADNGKFRLVLPANVKVAADMISLFPKKTFRNHRNGLRADLAQVIADLQPKFVRFPGGCVAHGNGLGNMYRWNRTVGPLEARVPQSNIWGYHQSAGLGYFEYFQFCEDIGAEPLPVLPAGVPCQNSSRGGKGQQGGIPMDQMDEYVQEVLDLIEWANGPATSKWGKIRAEAGHPRPFHLKYIGIGNEDLIGDVFTERYSMICKAIMAKYPEIQVVGTVGPFSEGADYWDGWTLAKKLKLALVDEHYYRSPGWFINHQDFYDHYERNSVRVYLGEYAAHVSGRHNCIESALAEAIYLTSVERNGDVVSMTSYAPLLCKDRHGNWNPDLIYFSNQNVRPTVGYYAQQMFSVYSGNKYAETQTKLESELRKAVVRVASSSVYDSKAKTATVKFVNILPVNVKTRLSLSGLKGLPVQAKVITLTGKPNSTDAKPVETTMLVNADTELTLPAYSFVVLHLPGVMAD